MLNIGIIGYGYWGPNLTRNFSGNPHCKLARIADLSEKRRKVAQAHYPGVEVTDRADIAGDSDLDAIVIATPVFTHFKLAKSALENGKHVWIEKPMTANVEQAVQLKELAAEKERVLMVDHTFLFTGAVQKMKELIDAGELGDLFYYDSVRINLGIFQPDVNVIWDLAPHDLSIMDYLVGKRPLAVAAHGSDHYGTGFVDVAYVSVFYENNLIGHFHVNWLSPVKLRRTVIGGSRKMLVWDDLSFEEKIKIYDKGMSVSTQEGKYRILAQARMGNMFSPNVDQIEALSSEVAYFVDCIEQKKEPHNNGAAGERVVSILEATELSLKENGKTIEIEALCGGK